MDQTNYFIEYGVISLAALFFVFLGIKYFLYWKQVKKAIIEAGMQWPLHSQKELNETARTNLPKSYGVMWSDMGQAARIIFSMRTNNPAIQKPLRGMRRVLLVFIISPFLLAFILVAALAFSAA